MSWIRYGLLPRRVIIEAFGSAGIWERAALPGGGTVGMALGTCE